MKRTILFPLGIICVVLILAAANFSSNLWLSGWDNLHPEFAFDVNIQRSFFAVWQEYQGLGLLGGMGHAADLPRQLLLLFLSPIVPANWLRQIYFFLMLAVGSLGLYFLLVKKILSSIQEDKRELASFLGSIFYLLNLGTVQTFYAPFESFVTHFGFLPWLFLVAFTYINHPTRKNLLFLIIINLFAIPEAYVPTTFLIYLVALTGSLAIYSVQRLSLLKAAVKVLIITLFINAFWLLPFLYFSFTSINVTVEAKINQMTTENVLLQNKKFGDITDVALLKGFWFDLTNYSQDTKSFDYLLLPWRKYLDNPFITTTGFLLFSIVLLGIFASFKERNQYRWIYVFLFLVPFVILANNTPPFSWIDGLLYRLPFLSQVLRSPFTKLSVLLAFSYSIFFAFGASFILGYIRFRWGKVLIVVGVVMLLAAFTFPVFTGNLFYKQAKVNMPEEYFKSWEFFKSQNPNSRIAFFPVQTFWGWNFYRWGYSGSGFLWYGLKQPILDRAFDVWSRSDENYYWEISQALYSKNQTLFEKVLEKYQVNWLLIDENVIYPSSPKSLYFDEIKQLLAPSNRIVLAQNFGKIKIYKVNLKIPENNFVFLTEGMLTVGPEYKWENFDEAYLKNGEYISLTDFDKGKQSPDVYYPFRSLLTSHTLKDLEFSIEEKGDHFIFRANLPQVLDGYYIEIPEIKKEDLEWVDPNDLSKVKNLLQDVYFNGKVIEVNIPKVGGLFSSEVEAGGKREFWFPNLPHNLSYLISVDSKNLAGKPFDFWIEDLNSRRAALETYLPVRPAGGPKSATSFFIQPSLEKDGLGYALHFDEKKIGNEISKNELGEIEIHPIPFNFLASLVLKRQNISSSQVLTSVKVDHPNPSIYYVDIPVSVGQNSTLVLSQSFDPGWQAWLYPGKFPLRRLTKHVLINNWENGWEIVPGQTGTVIIFYWPQLLEWSGLILMIGTFLYVGIRYLDKRQVI